MTEKQTTQNSKYTFKDYVGITCKAILASLIPIGMITTLLKLCKVINISWLWATSPIWICYLLFFIIMMYCVYFEDKVKNLFKK